MALGDVVLVARVSASRQPAPNDARWTAYGGPSIGCAIDTWLHQSVTPSHAPREHLTSCYHRAARPLSCELSRPCLPNLSNSTSVS